MTIEELKEFFEAALLPQEKVINRSTRITDVRKFVDSHLQVLRQNGDRPAFRAFHDRLIQLRELLVDDQQ